MDSLRAASWRDSGIELSVRIARVDGGLVNSGLGKLCSCRDMWMSWTGSMVLLRELAVKGCLCGWLFLLSHLLSSTRGFPSVGLMKLLCLVRHRDSVMASLAEVARSGP